jgi:CRISPR-associated endonuclease Cas1
MAATPHLYQLPSQSRKSGVWVVSGYGASIRVQRGHLVISDKGTAGTGETWLERVGHNVRRVVVITPDWYITGAALEWMTHQDVSLVVLERDGKVFCATGRRGSSDARLKRAQAALPGPEALSIAKRIVDAKLEGQEGNLRELLQKDERAALISGQRLSLYRRTDSLPQVRTVESTGAKYYWQSFREVPVSFQKLDSDKVPAHWKTWGSRYSPLGGFSPRLAITPAHAIVNYLYAVLESESIIACQKMGLDPALGILHMDWQERPSLALDVMEPVRPSVDRWVFEFLASAPLEKRLLWERPDGNCRLMAEFCATLAETAPLWEKTVSHWAEWLTQELWKANGRRGRKPAARLTQNTRRERFKKAARLMADTYT